MGMGSKSEPRLVKAYFLICPDGIMRVSATENRFGIGETIRDANIAFIRCGTRKNEPKMAMNLDLFDYGHRIVGDLCARYKMEPAELMRSLLLQHYQQVSSSNHGNSANG
jgi:hypothetical protein